MYAQIQKIRQGSKVFFNQKHITWMALQTSIEKQLDPRGPIASRGGSVSEFLREPIATRDVRGGGVQTPCPPSGSAHFMF